MKKFLVLFISLCLFSVPCFANDEKAVSTEGVELDSSIVKTVNKQSAEDKKIYKQERKAKRQYLKNISSIKKMRENKRLKQRNLEFLNSRLQIQKNKLEVLQEKKGQEK